ncbi:MAG: hypothetical protein WAX06_07160 [Lactococcus lactis]
MGIEIKEIKPIRINKSYVKIDENDETLATVFVRGLEYDSDETRRMFNKKGIWYLVDESSADPFEVELY